MAGPTKRRMVMVFLDSNTIIYLSKELIEIETIFSDDEEYAVSVITYMEVLGYDFDSNEEREFIEELLSSLTIIYIDEAISNKVIELKKVVKIKLPDAIICATTILYNSVLITNDIRLKNIQELKLNLIGI
ncbi:PIN domain-containing protein [Methylococcaceae bacterium HT4]|uniref:type II toxin-antitoxin system VapC family toxin n=1 Tax=Bathymodiolus platifrons methanotrophic gill symbiont TaxID=113268 RepID=UPI000B40B6C4|nr:type II toxin-antitoxin system VapC family toxin [Bathymodiolus platifrons methanotrophic gill symbiont]TXK96130.1 PIN domain-containing protein [Methylococcaceae bacterium CS4]TXK97791.1 PIN domain-containing protein [Methylococcaceae bacterium CS5]TXL05768.1 PIN domain-containing protein [Methylococcaceae bacterium CS1]TXL08121.1 PIN domain-containing protein [Methylococcaceae bacterium CS3]TXL10310.1 PIN domain-containing protein [Methylococcaceae bacterium CS2]TXL12930.1 PIN domain-con